MYLMVYTRGLETKMKWRIKTKTALDCVHKGFAWLPTKNRRPYVLA